MRPLHLVALLVACAAVATVGQAAPAFAESGAPATVARTASPGAAPIAPGIAVDHLGVQWRGPAAGGAVRFERRGRWGSWRPLHAGDLHRPGAHASELISAGGAGRYQVRLPPGARDARATAIGGRPVTASALGATARRTPRFGRCFFTRAGWGADESLRFDAAGAELWPPAYFEIQRLTLHHTATEGGAIDGSDPAATVRAIYRWHTVDLGFGDIGYQLLVDRDGCVYEGRHSGPDDRPVYAPRRPGVAPAAVNGGHTLGFNAGNVGVALIGNHDEVAPTPEALRATVRVLARLARRSGLDPLATGTYVNPITGAAKDIPTISGHQDWLATACPGAFLYPLLPGLRERVAARV